jgi:hypothetical protein
MVGILPGERLWIALTDLNETSRQITFSASGSRARQLLSDFGSLPLPQSPNH